MGMYSINKMRQAFSMIELIMIIVIIGILATVAIPRLVATRDDAKLAVKAKNIAIAAAEIATYATTKGKTESNLSIMSNSVESIVSQSEGTLAPYELRIKMREMSDCIILKIDNAGANTEVLIIEYGNNPNELCNDLRDLVDANKYPIPLRGNYVVR